MVSKLKCIFLVTVAALLIGMLSLLTGCPDDPAVKSDGTITLRITGAEEHNGKPVFCGVFPAGADMNDQNNMLGEGLSVPIVDGNFETLMYEVMYEGDPYIVPLVFAGGVSYDIGGMIDVDEDDTYTSNVDYGTNEIITVVVDGDMIVELIYPTDFSLAP